METGEISGGVRRLVITAKKLSQPKCDDTVVGSFCLMSKYCSLPGLSGIAVHDQLLWRSSAEDPAGS